MTRPNAAHPAAELAIEAIEVASGAVRRLLHAQGEGQGRVDTEAKHHRRLVERIRAGGPLRPAEARFIAGALAMLAVLHRTGRARDGARGPAAAAAYERAARQYAGMPLAELQPVFTSSLGAVSTLGAVGDRVIERATARAWWIDALDARRPAYVGVIPDVGPAVVTWRRAAEFERPVLVVGPYAD